MVGGSNMAPPLIKHVVWKNLRMHYKRMSEALCSVRAEVEGGSEWKLLEKLETLLERW